MDVCSHHCSKSYPKYAVIVRNTDFRVKSVIHLILFWLSPKFIHIVCYIALAGLLRIVLSIKFSKWLVKFSKGPSKFGKKKCIEISDLIIFMYIGSKIEMNGTWNVDPFYGPNIILRWEHPWKTVSVEVNNNLKFLTLILLFISIYPPGGWGGGG